MPTIGTHCICCRSEVCRPDARGLRHLDQCSGVYIIDVAVDRDLAWNQGMLPNTLDILDHTLGIVRDGQPVDLFGLRRAGTGTIVVPTIGLDPGRLQAAGE